MKEKKLFHNLWSRPCLSFLKEGLISFKYVNYNCNRNPAQLRVTSPQGTHLQVTQTPGQTGAPGQQIAVRSAAPVRLATGIKPVVTATDRPMQGVFLQNAY